MVTETNLPLWITEDITWPLMWGLLLLAIAGFSWFATKDFRMLFATLVIALLMILLVVVEQTITTDREYLIEAVYAMAVSVENNNADGVTQFVRPDNESFKNRIRRNMSQYDFRNCTVIGFSKSDLRPGPTENTIADIGFAVWATGSISGRPETFQTVNVRIQLEFKKTRGNWYIEAYGYQPANTTNDIQMNRN